MTHFSCKISSLFAKILFAIILWVTLLSDPVTSQAWDTFITLNTQVF